MVTNSSIGKLGRLGNSMFQIAAVIGYARENNMNYVLPKWSYAPHFKHGFTQSDIVVHAPRYSEKTFHYTKIPRQPKIDLYGYFQSKKYWQHCEAEIRRMFQPNDTIAKILEGRVPPNTCAVHVRRTDYLTLQDYHKVLPVEYYRDAMEKMGAERYIVFSDDIEGSKDMFAGRTDVEFVNSGNDIQDFFLAMQCDKFIIANSSFSWWFSYLSDCPDKRIIAPKKENWFGRKYHHHNLNDLYLPEWEIV